MLTHRKIVVILSLVVLLIISLVFAWGVSITTKTLNSLIVVPVVINTTPVANLPVEAQICRVFGSQCRMALAVSQAENGTRACDRKSATNDYGVFQINVVHAGQGFNLTNCLENIQLAKKIYDRQGWSPWSAYKNGSYKKFLIN